MNELQRREFLKIAGAGAGALLTGCASSASAAPGILRSGRSDSNIVVVGAGAFGGWTALNLQRMGARVTLVDMQGPGNSRSTSGDETRGVRSSYGDRPQGELWMQWARKAMTKWKEWDLEYAKPLRMRVFFTTGDLILRSDWEPFLTQTRAWWEKNKIPFETFSVDEVRKRWPAFWVDDINAVLYEPDAGVVRARRATEAVAEVFRYEGGRIVIGRVIPPAPGTFDGHTLRFVNGDTISADTFVFAVGPWLRETFAIMNDRMRTPLGTAVYYGTPEGDDRFTYPNMPSWNLPGTTGWAALPVDNRGFRVRGGSRRRTNANNTANGTASQSGGMAGDTTRNRDSEAMQDPDTSDRWADAATLERPRDFLEERFPAMKGAPILDTHSCHYELSSSRDFIVDQHPDMPTVWIAGGGNAEGFKMGPVIGEYVARRVLGDAGDPALVERFRIPKEEFGAARD